MCIYSVSEMYIVNVRHIYIAIFDKSGEMGKGQLKQQVHEQLNISRVSSAES